MSSARRQHETKMALLILAVWVVNVAVVLVLREVSAVLTVVVFISLLLLEARYLSAMGVPNDVK